VLAGLLAQHGWRKEVLIEHSRGYFIVARKV
jgi:hypothetical protein